MGATAEQLTFSKNALGFFCLKRYKGAISYEVESGCNRLIWNEIAERGAQLAVNNVAKFTLTSGTILGARTGYISHRRNRRLLSMDN